MAREFTRNTRRLNRFTRERDGLVPAPGGSGTTRYLREDGSWFTPPGTGGGGGSLPYFNVRDVAYGAVGDGSTNDATAISAAIDAAVAAGGGVVWFPKDQTGGNNTFLVGTQISKSTLSKIVFLGTPGVKIKKAANLNIRVFNFGQSGGSATFPQNTTVPSLEDVYFVDMEFEGKNRVQAKYFGIGNGTLINCTRNSGTQITITGADQTARFPVGSYVSLVNSGGTQFLNYGIVGTSTFTGGNTVLTFSTIFNSDQATTTASMSASVAACRMALDTTDNVIALYKSKNVKFINCKFTGIGNGAVRPATYAEGAIWWNYSDVPTYVNATTFTVPGDQTSRYPVGSAVQLSNNGANPSCKATIQTAVYDGSSLTTFTISVNNGSFAAGINRLERSLLDSGPFQGSVFFQHCTWDNVAQCVTSNDSGHNGIYFSDCLFLDSNGVKLTSQGYLKDARFVNCTFDGGSMTIWLQGCEDALIQGCTFKNRFQFAENGPAMSLGYNNLERHYVYSLSGIHVKDCLFDATGGTQVFGGTDTVTRNFTFAGNTIKNCTVGLNGRLVEISGRFSGLEFSRNSYFNNDGTLFPLRLAVICNSADTHDENFVIERNSISGLTTARPLEITRDQGDRSLRNVEITGNRIDTTTTRGCDFRFLENSKIMDNFSRSGFELNLWNKVTFQGNIIEVTSGSCVVVAGTDVNLSDNILTSLGTGASIGFSAGADRVLIERNTLYTAGTTGLGTTSLLGSISIRDNLITVASTANSFGAGVLIGQAWPEPVVTGNRINCSTTTGQCSSGIRVSGAAIRPTISDNVINTENLTAGGTSNVGINLEVAIVSATIQRNRISSAASIGISVSNAGVANAVIQENIISTTTAVGISVAQPAINPSILGNAITTTTGTGINVSSATASNVNCCNNIINSSDGVGINAGGNGGLYLANTINCTGTGRNPVTFVNNSVDLAFIDNLIKGVNRGIVFSTAAHRVLIKDNYVEMTAPAVSDVGINVTGTCDRMIVTGNRIRAPRAVPITINASPTRWVCADNQFFDTAAPALTYTGVSGPARANGFTFDPRSLTNGDKARVVVPIADAEFGDIVRVRPGVNLRAAPTTHTCTRASTTSVTIAGSDQTAVYTANRSVRFLRRNLLVASGFVTSSSFSTDTTVNVTLNFGSLPTDLDTITTVEEPLAFSGSLRSAGAWSSNVAGTLAVVDADTVTVTDAGVSHAVEMPVGTRVRVLASGTQVGYGYVTVSSYASDVTTLDIRVTEGTLTGATSIQYWIPGEAVIDISNPTGATLDVASSTWYVEIEKRV